MREAGALGARLTGAGFGGCAVALVHDSGIEKVLETVKEKYYGEYIPHTHPELPREGILFAVKPSRGAIVYPGN
jgi:galactokinase